MSRVLVESGIEWIGKYPAEWNLSPLRGIVDNINEKNNPIKFTNVLSLTNKLGVVPYEEKGDLGNISKEDISQYKIAYKDTVIINSMNLKIGSVGYSNYDGCVSPVYYVLKNNEKSDISFINYIFQSNFQKYLGKYGKGILEIREKISMYDILHSYIPVPSLIEQKRIADFLDKKCFKVDQIISDNNYEIQLLEEYKISIIENTVKNYNKDCSLRNIDWITSCDKNVELIKLKYNSIISTGTTPKDFEKNETSNKIDWFTPSDFKSIVLNNSVRKLDIDLVAENKMFPKNTTLIIGIGGTLGKVGITQDKCYSNQQITALIGNNKIIPKYLTYNLLSAQKYIKDTCPYTTLPILSNSYLKNIFICIRSKEEQEKIVEYLDNQILKIDEVIDYRKKIIEKLEEYKKSLIYECVTGKKEV